MSDFHSPLILYFRAAKSKTVFAIVFAFLLFHSLSNLLTIKELYNTNKMFHSAQSTLQLGFASLNSASHLLTIFHLTTWQMSMGKKTWQRFFHTHPTAMKYVLFESLAHPTNHEIQTLFQKVVKKDLSGKQKKPLY